MMAERDAATPTNTNATANTIVWGFAWGGDSSSSRRKYAWNVLTPNIIPIMFDAYSEKEPKHEITFYNRDIVDILLYNNEPMVFTM